MANQQLSILKIEISEEEIHSTLVSMIKDIQNK